MAPKEEEPPKVRILSETQRGVEPVDLWTTLGPQLRQLRSLLEQKAQPTGPVAESLPVLGLEGEENLHGILWPRGISLVRSGMARSRGQPVMVWRGRSSHSHGLGGVAESGKRRRYHNHTKGNQGLRPVNLKDVK